MLCKIQGNKYRTAKQYGADNNQGTLHEKAFRQKQDNRIFLCREEPVVIVKNNFVKQYKNPVKINGAG